MGVSRIDFVTLVNNAYYCQKYQSYEEYTTLTADLLNQGYVNFDMFGSDILAKYAKGKPDAAFTLVHNLLTLFVYSDTRLRQNEYDVYVKFCEKSNHNSFDPSQLREHRLQFTSGDLSASTSLVRELRGSISPSYYQNFVYGLVLLSLMDTGSFTSDSYEIISGLLSSSVDNCPSYGNLMAQVTQW